MQNGLQQAETVSAAEGRNQAAGVVYDPFVDLWGLTDCKELAAGYKNVWLCLYGMRQWSNCVAVQI